MMKGGDGTRVCIHAGHELAGIRRAAQAAAWVRDCLEAAIQPGMSTLDIDRQAAALIGQAGGRPAFYRYRGFPGQICISLNDEVVHGIGSPSRVVRVGDVVKLDVGVALDGFIGDTATTVCVGPPPAPEIARLLAVTRDCLAAGIRAARGGARVNDIGAAVQRLAERNGLGVVREYVGHGVGRELHEPPEVPNFRTAAPGPRLRPGMVLAIEPMINAGTPAVTVDADGWTVRTEDGRCSAHYEHMVLITQDEPEILTWAKNP